MLLIFKSPSKTFTQITKAISNYIYLLSTSVIFFHSTLSYELIGIKNNPCVAVNLESLIMYSKDTSTLLLTFELCYKPLGIFQKVIKKKYVQHRIKVLWSIFNYSVKKLSNSESSFLNSGTSWKNKTPTISTKTLRITIYLSKHFLQIQSFFIVWNKKQMIFVLGTTG